MTERKGSNIKQFPENLTTQKKMELFGWLVGCLSCPHLGRGHTGYLEPVNVVRWKAYEEMNDLKPAKKKME